MHYFELFIWVLFAHQESKLVNFPSDSFIYFYCIYSENVGLLALTRVGSRRVIQISAVFMLFFSILGVLCIFLILYFSIHYATFYNQSISLIRSLGFVLEWESAIYIKFWWFISCTNGAITYSTRKIRSCGCFHPFTHCRSTVLHLICLYGYVVTLFLHYI